MSTVRYLHRRALLAVLLTAAAGGMVLSTNPALAQGDPLPSWNDGKAKQSILSVVADVAREGSPDFVPVPQRIATFDNDGPECRPWTFPLGQLRASEALLRIALDRVRASFVSHDRIAEEES
jgi:hypothetical protein